MIAESFFKAHRKPLKEYTSNPIPSHSNTPNHTLIRPEEGGVYGYGDTHTHAIVKKRAMHEGFLKLNEV